LLTTPCRGNSQRSGGHLNHGVRREPHPAGGDPRRAACIIQRRRIIATSGDPGIQYREFADPYPQDPDAHPAGTAAAMANGGTRDASRPPPAILIQRE